MKRKHRYLVTRHKHSTPQTVTQVLGRLTDKEDPERIRRLSQALAVWDWEHNDFVDELPERYLKK